MNLTEAEQIRGMKLRSRDVKSRQSSYFIEYLNQPFYNDLRDMIVVQLGSCEQLLAKTKSIDQRNVIEREAMYLKLVLELLEYWWKNRARNRNSEYIQGWHYYFMSRNPWKSIPNYYWYFVTPNQVGNLQSYLIMIGL